MAGLALPTEEATRRRTKVRPVFVGATHSALDVVPYSRGARLAAPGRRARGVAATAYRSAEVALIQTGSEPAPTPGKPAPHRY